MKTTDSTHPTELILWQHKRQWPANPVGGLTGFRRCCQERKTRNRAKTEREIHNTTCHVSAGEYVFLPRDRSVTASVTSGHVLGTGVAFLPALSTGSTAQQREINTPERPARCQAWPSGIICALAQNKRLYCGRRWEDWLPCLRQNFGWDLRKDQMSLPADFPLL